MKKIILVAMAVVALVLGTAAQSQAVMPHTVAGQHWYDAPVKPASIRSARLQNGITVSGVSWAIICDLRWDYGGPGGTTFIMKSTTCKTTRDGAASSVKFDAIRFYVDNGTSASETPISLYQFCGAITTTDDCEAATDATHTQDQNMGNWSGNITMKTWGLPNPSTQMLRDQSAMNI